MKMKQGKNLDSLPMHQSGRTKMSSTPGSLHGCGRLQQCTGKKTGKKTFKNGRTKTGFWETLFFYGPPETVAKTAETFLSLREEVLRIQREAGKTGKEKYRAAKAYGYLVSEVAEEIAAKAKRERNATAKAVREAVPAVREAVERYEAETLAGLREGNPRKSNPRGNRTVLRLQKPKRKKTPKRGKKTPAKKTPPKKETAAA